MPVYKNYHDTVHWHMSELSSRIVAQSGIPSDRFHLGKIVLQSLQDSPELVAQIEGSTGESETNRSLLQRSIQCAIGLTKLGVKQGDILTVCAPNTLDVVVPLYAALYLGIIYAPITWSSDKDMGKYLAFQPNIVFTLNEKLADIMHGSKELMRKPKIITFDKGDEDMTFADVLQLGEDKDEIAKFRPTDFNPSEAIAFLIATSGTTGVPKFVPITHKNFSYMGTYFWLRTIKFPSFSRILVLSSNHVSTSLRFLTTSSFMKFTRIVTIRDPTPNHVYELINKYKPSYMSTHPYMMISLLRADPEKCDFSCFERIYIGGCPVPSNLFEEMKKLSPKTEVLKAYGMTELMGAPFLHGFSSPPESCGMPIGCLQYRLVDVETGRDVDEPHVNGELWLKGPGLTKGYYNNPQATAEAFVDGWYKTGDLLYRDANWNFYFKDRIRLFINYNHYKISPFEIEAVISQHPGVLHVVVTSIRVPDYKELPVAVVVAAPSAAPTAQEIKDLVKAARCVLSQNSDADDMKRIRDINHISVDIDEDNIMCFYAASDTLGDIKQLRGGVIFLDQLPMIGNVKVDRRKITDMAYMMSKQ